MPNLCDRFKCTGCSACYNVCSHDAIIMAPDKEGFLIPNINDELCIECGLCTNSCPVLTEKNRVCLDKPSVYAAYIKDEEIRKSSSSGGLFSAIAKVFFENTSVKSYVVAASFDEHLVLRHTVASSIDEIICMRGSKYVQSNIGLLYRQVKERLKEGAKVLFVGTPCQVAGIKSFLGKDIEKLYTVDLICHGTPSPALFDKYLQKVGIDQKKKFKDYFFRDFKSSVYFISSAITEKGKRQKVSISNHSYITAYLKGWIHRESCYKCKFSKMPRQGDCTIGDFWGILSGKVPFNGNSQNGVSIVLTSTEKGKQILESVKDFIYYETKTLEDAIIDNHNLVSSEIRPLERDYIYKELEELEPNRFMKKYHLYLPHQSFKSKAKAHIKTIIKCIICQK
jgi:coenzyme F420-reducing hydrogenase beta subunit